MCIYKLNRKRGEKSIWAKYTAVFLGALFGLTTLNSYIGVSMVLLYIAFESFGFQISLDWASGTGSTKWANAEYNYGGIQDTILIIVSLALLF